MAGVFRPQEPRQRKRYRHTVGPTNLELTATQGLIHVIGQNPTVTKGRSVTAQQGLIHVIGQNPTVSLDRGVTAQQGLIHVIGQDPTLTKGLAITAQQGLIHVIGQNPTIKGDRAITAQQGLIHVVGQNAQIGEVEQEQVSGWPGWPIDPYAYETRRREARKREREEEEAREQADKAIARAQDSARQAVTLRKRQRSTLNVAEVSRLIDALEEAQEADNRRKRLAAILLLMA